MRPAGDLRLAKDTRRVAEINRCALPGLLAGNARVVSWKGGGPEAQIWPEVAFSRI